MWFINSHELQILWKEHNLIDFLPHKDWKLDIISLRVLPLVTKP